MGSKKALKYPNEFIKNMELYNIHEKIKKEYDNRI